jgi:hypothetical protein
MMLDFDKVSSEARAMFSDALNGMYDTLAAFESIEAKYKELANIGGMNISQIESRHGFIHEMRLIRRIIRGNTPGINDGENGLAQLLARCERACPETITTARGELPRVGALLESQLPKNEVDSRPSKTANARYWWMADA